MLTVPVYNGFQVDERPQPGLRQESIASSSLLNGGAAALDAFGKGLQNAGGDLAGIAGKMQDRANATAIFDADTRLKNDYVQFQIQTLQRKGVNAKGAVEDTKKWFDENAPKYAEGLTNPVQQRLYSEAVAKLHSTAMGTVSEHEAVQSRNALNDQTDASISADKQLAVASPFNWAIAKGSADAIKRKITVAAEINGIAPEKRDQMILGQVTDLHKQMIQQLTVSSPGAAEAYFKEHKDQIDPTQWAEIGKFAETATSVSLGASAAQGVWDRLAPKSSTDPVKLLDMEDAIRKELKGNDTAIEHGIKGIRERAQAYTAQTKSEANALEAGVNGLILKGATAAQLRASPEYLTLSAKDPEAARKIDTFMENKDYLRIARSAAAESRADAAESRAERRLHRDTIDTTLRLSDPAVLAKIGDRNEIVNLLPIIGTASTEALLNRYDSITKSAEAYKEAVIDRQEFERLAISAGVQVNGLKSTDVEKKDRLVFLQDTVENAIAAEQRARGNKALTREEKGKIMQRVIDDTVMLKHWYGNEPISSGMVMPKDDIAIPKSFSSQAIAARKAQGLPVDDATIRALWLNTKNRKDYK